MCELFLNYIYKLSKLLWNIKLNVFPIDIFAVVDTAHSRMREGVETLVKELKGKYRYTYMYIHMYILCL